MKVKNWAKSIGILRLNTKTKDRSPDLIGTVKIHYHLIHTLLKKLDESAEDVAECNIAAWQYRDKDGPLLNLQLSERFEWCPLLASEREPLLDTRTAPALPRFDA